MMRHARAESRAERSAIVDVQAFEMKEQAIHILGGDPDGKRLARRVAAVLCGHTDGPHFSRLTATRDAATAPTGIPWGAGGRAAATQLLGNMPVFSPAERNKVAQLCSWFAPHAEARTRAVVDERRFTVGLCDALITLRAITGIIK